MPPLPRAPSSAILVPPRTTAPISEHAYRFELACIARAIVGAGLGELLPMALLTAPRASDVVTTERLQ